LNIGRRSFLQRSIATVAWGSSSSLLCFQPNLGATSTEARVVPFGDGEVLSLTDGQLSLPVSFMLPDSIDENERTSFLESQGLGPDTFTPQCNVTLWRTADRLVLFDLGAGTQFMPGAGLLPESLAAVGIDAFDITDVVLTHAHPDHLWGALDDFDELAYPNATYHVHRGEREYWLADDTLTKTPDARKPFVVGAQNRLPLFDDMLSLFEWGDELLPGIEAIDTHGHTPGHTSFALHDGSNSLIVVGDALTNAAISFERPKWPSGSDQNPEQGVRTRLALLDRLSVDKSMILGYHLNAPGIGQVERLANAYRFVPDA